MFLAGPRPAVSRGCARHQGCDCVTPLTPARVTADAPPDRLDHHERMRIRAAAARAPKLYPGPVGRVLERELLTWEEFGYRLGRGGLVTQLVDHIMAQP